jgi:ABC-type transport system involved in multi-copper enzyme maturation permease subunit
MNPETDPLRPSSHSHRIFSLNRLGALATNTLLDLVRQKVFYFLLLFALLSIGSSLFMVQFTFQQQFQVLKDVSLGAMSVFSWLLAVLCTAQILPRDIEDRTLYTILAKPVPRFEYLLGKLGGILLLLAIALSLMSVVFAAVLFWREQAQLALLPFSTPPEDLPAAIQNLKASTFTPSLGLGILMIFLRSAICATLTLLISSFASSSIFTVIISVMAYIIGHIQPIARDYWLNSLPAGQGISPFLQLFLGFVALAFPDFQLFNLVDDVAAGNIIPLALLAKTAALGLGYAAVYSFLAYLFFANKEL